MKIVYAVSARRELQTIGAFLSEQNPAAARRMVDGILRACEALADMPLRCPLVPGRETSGIRRRIHRNYLIFYRVEKASVQILHVIHGAMDYEKILGSLD